MTVIDMRNTLRVCDIALIEINDQTVWYAEEKIEEGHNTLFLLEYDHNNRQERIVANYILRAEYCRHYFPFPNELLVVMENGGSSAWILRIDKHTGKEQTFEQINFIGNFLHCTALDSDHLLIVTGKNETHSHLFTEYHALTGLPRMAYLYSLPAKTYHCLKDARLCPPTANWLVPYQTNSVQHLLVLSPNGSEREKEHCYQNRTWLGNHVCDQVFVCTVPDLAHAAQTDQLPELQTLFCADSSALLRYVGMDADNLYFKAKYFPWNDQRLCGVQKSTGKRFVAAPLTRTQHQPPAQFCFDTANMRGFCITAQKESLSLQGFFGSTLNAVVPKTGARLLSCIEDRYIITTRTLPGETTPITNIYDTQTQQTQSNQSRCKISGNTVVLY